MGKRRNKKRSKSKDEPSVRDWASEAAADAAYAAADDESASAPADAAYAAADADAESVPADVYAAVDESAPAPADAYAAVDDESAAALTDVYAAAADESAAALADVAYVAAADDTASTPADAAYAAADKYAAASADAYAAAAAEASCVADVDVVDDGDQSALYFSASLWRARGLLGNNAHASGKTSDPYILVKYGDQEVKTKVVTHSRDPVWKAHVMLEYDGRSDIELYVFSADDLLGHVAIALPDPLPAEPAFCVLDREWLRVAPCSTTVQDNLNTFSNVRRSLTRTLRVFRDTEWLHKQEDLGEVCVSLNAFRLDELPSLVRRSAQSRRLSQTALQDATLRLEADVGTARRDADRSERVLEVERAKTVRLEEEASRLEARHDAARAELRQAADDQAELDRRELRLRGVAEGAQSENDAWREHVRALEADIAAVENERDRERLRARKMERERDDALRRASAPATGDLSLEDLQERIHGLTLAYYYMKRKRPPVAPALLLDHVNRYSLPGAPPLGALADGDRGSSS